jgi:hypothetical protein
MIDDVAKLNETLEAAHAAFMREKGRADTLQFQVEKLEREIEMYRAELAQWLTDEDNG